MAHEVALLDGEGAVVLLAADGLGLQLVVGVVVEGGEAAAVEVVDVFAAVDGRDGVAAGDVAVEHAVHHHGPYVGGFGGVVVVAHDAADVGAAGDGGVAVAVDHTGGAVEQTHQSAGISRAAHRAAEDADVVDAGRVVGGAGYGAGIAAMVADGHLVEHQVLYGAGEGFEEGCVEAGDAVGHVGVGVDGGLEGAAEGADAGGAAADVLGNDVVDVGCGDLVERGDFDCLAPGFDGRQ